MKRKLRCSVLLGLVFTLMLGISLVVAPTGQKSNTVQAANNVAAFNFVVTSTTELECDVRLADKTVTRAIVPDTATINGTEYKVTSVAANGFASAANLEKVRLPKSVKTIGQNAFMNCKNLSSITLPGVVTINANAFQMCPKLGRIVIPKSTISVGATILRNNTTQVYFRGPKSQADAWTSTWNNNNSIQEVDYDSKFVPELQYKYVSKAPASNSLIMPVTEYDDYWIVDDYQEFIDLETEVDIYVPAVKEGKPVVEIMDYAFAGNTLNTITIGYGADPIRLGEGAFHSFEGHTIIINRSFYYNDEVNGVGEMLSDMFACAKSTKIVLPDDVYCIGDKAFQECEATDIYFRAPEPGLAKDDEKKIADGLVSTGIVQLPNSLKSIGEEAFDSAINIKQLHLPVAVDDYGVTEVGHRAFANWDVRGEGWQEIHTGYENEDALPTGWINTNLVTASWKAGINNYSIVNYSKPQIFTITFHPYGDITYKKNYTPKDSFTFDAATRTGYKFEYWFIPETGLRMDGINVGTTGNISLEAKWTAISYTITYDKNKPSTTDGEVEGETAGATGIKSYEFGKEYTLEKNNYSLKGWIFIDWNTKKDGSGTSYEDRYNPVLNWKEEQDANITLYAQWKEKTYTVIYHGNRPDKSNSGVIGLPDNSPHTYDIRSYLRSEEPTMAGWTFTGWKNSKGRDYTPGQPIKDVNDGAIDGDTLDLFAQWIQKSYSVVYDKNLPTKAAAAGRIILGDMDDSQFKYDDAEKLRENDYKLANWTFIGWNTKKDGSGKSYKDEQEDLNFAGTSESSVTLYAQWNQDEYTVTYHSNKPNTSPNIASHDVTGDTPASKFKYDEIETLRVNGFNLIGWTFQGWATSPNGTVAYPNRFDQVYNFVGLNLYAVWKQNTYTVIYYSNRPTTATHPANASNAVGNSMANSVYSYDVSSNLRQNAYTLTGWTFAGWATSPAGSVVYGNTATVWNWFEDNGIVYELYARWTQNEYTITLNRQGATNGTASVAVKYDSGMPSATAPSQTGFVFDGYYSSTNGSGTQYYDKQMNSLRNWTTTSNATLYAKWIGNSYQIAYNPNGGSGSMTTTSHIYGTSSQLSANTFTPQTGKGFKCWNTAANGTGTSYSNKEWISTGAPSGTLTLYAQWETFTYLVEVRLYGYVPPWPNGGEPGGPIYGEDFFFEYYPSFYLVWNESRDVTVPATYTAHGKTWEFYQYWSGHNTSGYSSGRTITLKNMVTEHNDRLWLNAEYREKKSSGPCVAEGTMITLADGSQKAVENLDGSELLLVWNLQTGAFDFAPILFIDKHSQMTYEIIHLYFSDGTEVKVIGEHAFWDFDFNCYVFIRADAAQYLNHWFNKQIKNSDGSMSWTRVQLVDVQVYYEVNVAWSPVTFGHLCYYVNGMLSMPGATEGLINIFEVDGNTMQIIEALFLADIEMYGLFTYADFEELIPEIIFEAFNGQYLSVSLGKGLITWEQLEDLIEHYAKFFGEQPEQPAYPGNSGNPNNGGGNNGAGNNGNGNGKIGNGQGNGNGKGNGNGGRP